MAEEAPASASGQDLAKKSQNPISTLVSVPFENNINYNAGPLNKTDNILTIKPVYPASLNDDWNLISRLLIPFQSVGARAPGSDRQKGLGDIAYQGFFSPSESKSGITWGIGPNLLLRTGTSDMLTADQWGIGPNFVALMMPGRWVVGALVSNVWSVAGDDDAPDVNLGTVQYFVNYNLDAGWYLTMSPVITANWEAKDSQTWTVPVGGGFGRVFKMGNQPLNAKVAAYYNVENPRSTSDWTLQFQLTFLFPR